MHVERAVLGVGLEQPVERQQAGEQRRDPERAGRDAREDRRVRADAERHQQHDDQEERRAPSPAPPPERSARLSSRRSTAARGVHAIGPARNGSADRGRARTARGREPHVRRRRRAQVDMGGDDREAAAGAVGAHQRREPRHCRRRRARRSARRAATAGAAPARAARGPAGAAARRSSAAAGRSASGVERRTPTGPRDRVAARRRTAPPRSEVLGDGQLRLDRVEMAGDRRSARSSRPDRREPDPVERRRCRPATGNSPASARSSVDLPAPFGPRSSSADRRARARSSARRAPGGRRGWQDEIGDAQAHGLPNSRIGRRRRKGRRPAALWQTIRYAIVCFSHLRPLLRGGELRHIEG